MTWRHRLRPWKRIKYLEHIIHVHQEYHDASIRRADEHMGELRASIGNLTRRNAEMELELRLWREEGDKRGIIVQ